MFDNQEIEQGESGSTPSVPGDIPALVRRLATSIERATVGLSSAKAEVILEASELLAVTVLHVHAASVNAAEALERTSRSFDVDALTGLPNRLLFRDRCAQALAYGRRRHTRVAVLFIDLDDFKSVNDTLGHAIGDELLRHVARCLQESGREVDTVCRLGGDEFLILLSDAIDETAPVLYAEKALAALDVPLRVGDNILRIGASIGIALYPEDGQDPEALIRQSDAAMYVAKRTKSRIAHASMVPATSRTPTPATVVAQSDPIGLLERSLQESQGTVADLKASNTRLRAELESASSALQTADSGNRHQAELLHLVAHELRNAMSPLQSASDVLGLMHRDATVLPRLELILRRQIAHISRLLSDILDVSRLNNGRLAFKSEQLDLCTLVSATSQLMSGSLQHRAQSLRIASEHSPVSVEGDPSRLRHVLTTLIEYASSHMADGATLEVSVLRRARQAVVWMDYSDRHADAATHGVSPLPNSDAAVDIGSPDGPTFALFVATEFVKLHNGELTLTRDRDTALARIEICLPLVG